MTSKYYLFIFLAFTVVLWMSGLNHNIPFAEPAPTSIQTVLSQSWDFYKNRFLINEERVESNHYGGTITEGQSYALLKAVWMDDRATFDRVWQWTQIHMARPKDHLFGWRWGEREDGSFGLIYLDNAADADQDIAYALLLAGERWQNPVYTAAAKNIIADFWTHNIAEINGKYYVVPGTWEGFRQAEALTVNPSYLAPYVYRKFAQYDPGHPWKQVADGVYPLLNQCSTLTQNNLPPNWCGVRWDNNQVTYSDIQGEGARDFGYDAFRVFWRMAMDARLGSHEARAYLESHPYLLSYWEKHHTLPEGFSWQGEAHPTSPSGFSLSAAIAQASIIRPEKNYYGDMLAPHYHKEGFWFNDYNDYLHSVIWLHLHTLSDQKI